jgi:hypothetical protein
MSRKAGLTAAEARRRGMPAVPSEPSGNGSATAPSANTASSSRQQPPQQASGHTTGGDTSGTETCRCGASRGLARPDRCERGHPWRGLPGPALKHGLRGHHEPAAEPAAGWRSTWATYRGSLHAVIESATANARRRTGSARDIGATRQLLDLIRDAKTLDMELAPAGEGANVCGFGHRDCAFIGTPELELAVMTRAAIAEAYPRLVYREPDCIAAALLADGGLRDDVLHRIASARAAAEREQAEVEAVPQVITFGADGEVIPFDDDDDGEDE